MDSGQATKSAIILAAARSPWLDTPAPGVQPRPSGATALGRNNHGACDLHPASQSLSGAGELRKQTLHDIHTGEIATTTGPSGSGQTTLLTVVCGLRSVQDGSVQTSASMAEVLNKLPIDIMRSLGLGPVIASSASPWVVKRLDCGYADLPSPWRVSVRSDQPALDRRSDRHWVPLAVATLQNWRDLSTPWSTNVAGVVSS